MRDFQSSLADGGSPVSEDPAELPLFERALVLYRALGDTRGEAEALFWIGCVHQFIRGDNATAVPLLELSYRLATEVGDKRTQSEALRHLGIAAHAAGLLDKAREQLEDSSRLRREIGLLAGVASNMIGLALHCGRPGPSHRRISDPGRGASHRRGRRRPRHRAEHRAGESKNLVPLL